VHRYGRFFAGGVFWLGFASADEVLLQVAACSSPEFESRSLEERVRLVTTGWQSAVPRLLVFDNCEEEALLETWRPTSGGCRMLMTSRRALWSPTLGVTALPLDLMPRPDSIELLRRYRPDLAADDPRIDAIANKLGDLPLALHLAGRYLLAYRAEISLDDYLAELDQPALIEHASLLGEGLDDSPSPTHHVQSLAQTFALCLGRLDREREVVRVAIALLARMACMAPGERVPRDLLARTLEEVSPRSRADGLRQLGAVGLVEEGEGGLRLHRLVAHFVRQEGLDGSARAAVDRALRGSGEAARDGLLMGSGLTATIPHIAYAASGEMDEQRLAALCRSAGLAMQAAGDIRSARRWLERALTIRKKALGEDHPDTLASFDDLGEQLRMQGEFAAARPVQEHVLAARERLLGPVNEDIAQSANNLALVLWQQGELDAARRLLERAVATSERAMGSLSKEVAVSLNNLARVLVEQGELAAAQPLQERSLYICERVSGPDHVFTSNALNSLARLLQARGDLAGARPLFDRALTIRERAVGVDHPRTAGSLHNLAALLVDQGDPAAARTLFERALAIRERVLGPDHPDATATRRALAELAADSQDAAP
jgi:tetratricopeptide (TPR) repeat protein